MHHNFTTKQFNLSIYISAVLFEHLGFNVIYIFYLYINVLVAVFVLFIQNRHDFYVSLFVFSDLKISTMREEEKALRQKLSEMEKAKKQLQCDLASRDRTIQQLRAVSSGRSVCLTMPFFFISFSSPPSGTILWHKIRADTPSLPESLQRYVCVSLSHVSSHWMTFIKTNRFTSDNETFWSLSYHYLHCSQNTTQNAQW